MAHNEFSTNKPQTQNKLTEEQKANILAYTNEITTLGSFVEAVRQTADVYIGALNNIGFITLLREVFQNGTDELQKKESTCDHVIITFDERTNWVIVEDNGRGFPHGRLIDIISKDHTSSNYKKEPYQYTAGKNGMGIGIVNALSSEFYIESSVLGVTHRVEFKEGFPWDKGEITVKSDKYQGSIVSFRPCIDVLGDITVTWTEVFRLVSLILPTLKIGAVIYFNSIDLNGRHHKEMLVNEDGILSHLINICESPMTNPIYIFQDNGTMKVEVMFTYDVEDTNTANIMSFNNFCPTSSGTHELGFTDGVCNFFRGYMNKIFLSGKKLQIVNGDILCGMRAIVNTCLLTPKYDGQNKDILNNPEIRSFAATVIYNALDDWGKKNPKDLQKICKWIKEIAEVRLKNDNAKIRISNNYKKNAISGSLPESYDAPAGKNDGHWEFIIVEGKSAAQQAMTARDPHHQGILGIRGKFPNAMSKSREDILNNAEVSKIISILDEGRGINYGPKFDIKLCPYEKIIIATDADEDGKGHIRPLLQKFFLMYMTPIVLEGRLYAAQPPLYMAKIGKNDVYFSDDLELSKYVLKEFAKKNSIADMNNRKLSIQEISALIVRNLEYVQLMNNLASSFAINVYLLEAVLNNYDKGYGSLKAVIEKQWRFMKVTKTNGLILVSGTIDKSQTIPIDDRLIGACGHLLVLMRKSNIMYKVNGQAMGLYDTIKTFDSLKPANINRFKGLGEMNSQQLMESTIHPKYDRTIIRYTVEDIKKEMAEIRKVESDFSVLLRDIRDNGKGDML